jgi:predicted protein tyrosine phosphatase
MKELFVYSRPAIERLPPHDVPYVVISITSAPDDVARIPRSSALRAILRLSFADADVDAPAGLVLFDEAHARSIVEFVRAHERDIDRIVVHCDAGMSRSPAVAAAITRSMGEDDAAWFKRYRPNMRVYRRLLEALESARE